MMVSGKLVDNGAGDVVASATLQPIATRETEPAPGEMVDLFAVDPGAVEVVGTTFTVRLDPAAVPPTHMSRTGLVTLDLQFVHPSAGRLSYFLQRTRRMCGSNDVPAWARTVREGYRS